ncbi:MAG: VWA domain-containing protein [Ignavibacteria bacterium]|nr:VWA domain-containing protein [Ignavibacteria bacterium]
MDASKTAYSCRIFRAACVITGDIMKCTGIFVLAAWMCALTIDVSAGVLYARRPGTETPVYPLRISNIRTSVTINGQFAVTHVDEEFFNDNNLTLEGFYAFHLPDGARVDGLWLWENGQRKTFVCLKKEDAIRTYDSLLSDPSHDPAMLEALGQNRFQLKVYPIAPKSSRRIEIQYFQTLALTEDGFIHYRYPLNLSGYQTKPVESTSMTFTVSSCTRILDFKTAFDGNPMLNRVTKVDENTYTVFFGLENTLYSLDYELAFAPEGVFDMFPTLSWKDPVHLSADGYFITWHGWKDDSGSSRLRDLVFVLDNSGSMAGDRVREVTGAVTQVLQKLRPTDHFRLVLFHPSTNEFRRLSCFLSGVPDTIALAIDFINTFYQGNVAPQLRAGVQMRTARKLPARRRQAPAVPDGWSAEYREDLIRGSHGGDQCGRRAGRADISRPVLHGQLETPLRHRGGDGRQSTDRRKGRQPGVGHHAPHVRSRYGRSEAACRHLSRREDVPGVSACLRPDGRDGPDCHDRPLDR